MIYVYNLCQNFLDYFNNFFAIICLEYSDIILPLLLLVGKYSALNGIKYFTKKIKVSIGVGGWGRGH